MAEEPYNAGKTVTVRQIIELPMKDIDFGSIIVTENWGRLFIKRGDNEIVVIQSAYNDLVEAISSFIDPSGITRQEPKE